MKPDEIDVAACRRVMEEFCVEYAAARKAFARDWSSPHEGYGVMLEEIDEMWYAIKTNNMVAARAEAVQVGAMVLRFIVECCR